MFDYEESWRGDWNDTTRYGPACRHRRRIVARLTRRLPHAVIHDLGCGDGSLIAEISWKIDARLFGSDISAEAVARAKRNVPTAEFTVMDLARQIPEGPVDVAILSEVLEHIEHDQDLIARLSKVARHVVISVPGGPADKVDTRYGHFRNYHHDTARQLLEQNGFDVIHYRRWGVPFYEAVQLLMNRCANADEVAGGRYGPGKRLLARLIYILFFLNVVPAGTQVFAVGRSRNCT